MAIYSSAAVVLGATCILLEEEKQKNAERSVWVHDWVEKRESEGCYAKLLPELRANNPNLFKNFLRMSEKDFDYLTGLVSPFIAKQDTCMRKSISAGERLAVTLRFLATGDSFRSLQYVFRIPQTTISRIVPETCDAIYNALQPLFMTVSNCSRMTL